MEPSKTVCLTARAALLEERLKPQEGLQHRLQQSIEFGRSRTYRLDCFKLLSGRVWLPRLLLESQPTGL